MPAAASAAAFRIRVVMPGTTPSLTGVQLQTQGLVLSV